MKTLRIGLVTEWFLPETGGGETHVIELAEWLERRGHEVHLLLGERIYRKYIAGRKQMKHIRAHCLKMPVKRYFESEHSLKGHANIGWAFVLHTAYQNGELIKRLKLDILHAHSVSSAYACLILAKVLHIPAVLTAHINYLSFPSFLCANQCGAFVLETCLRCRKNKFPWLKNRREAFWDMGVKGIFAYNANRIIVLSNALKKNLKRIHALDAQVTVIPNWVRRGRFRRKPIRRPASAPMTILYVGRIIPLKGIEDIVRAMPEILKRIPGCRLIVVGRVEKWRWGTDGFHQKLHKLIQALGLSRRIVFTGNVDYAGMPEVYRRADVLVHPSYSETQGLVLLEAMAAGVPVVTTRLATIREYITHGENGLLVKPGDVKAISRAVIQVLQKPELYKRLVRNAYRTVKTRFAVEKVLPRIERVYREEIGKNRENTINDPR